MRKVCWLNITCKISQNNMSGVACIKESRSEKNGLRHDASVRSK